MDVEKRIDELERRVKELEAQRREFHFVAPVFLPPPVVYPAPTYTQWAVAPLGQAIH